VEKDVPVGVLGDSMDKNVEFPRAFVSEIYSG
jgi:hypothetical protein